jgi:hypothetical protein
LVDVLFSVSPISSSLEGVSLVGESSSGTSKFEGPQEVVGFFEVGSNSVDLVDEVLDVVDSVGSQRFLDDGVGSKGDSLLVRLSVTSLEDEFSDGFSGRITECDIGFNSSEDVS